LKPFAEAKGFSQSEKNSFALSKFYLRSAFLIRLMHTGCFGLKRFFTTMARKYFSFFIDILHSRSFEPSHEYAA